ncbi:MAG: class III signal peptide-containing protein, partial [archaeon]|nr:class III signal peptide-containing protein [archaeon]
MGANFLKNKKGQISIEFILIMLIAIIYIYSVIQPTLQISAQSTEDVARISNVKLSAQKLAGTINQLEANASEGRRTIDLFIPDGSYIECNADAI